MKKAVLFVLLFLFTLLIVPGSFAIGNWIYEAENVDMNISISSKIEIIPLNDDFKISYLSANLTYIPMNTDNQEVTNIIFSPKNKGNKSEKGYHLFEWGKTDDLKLDFGIIADLNVNNEMVYIWDKSDFPIKIRDDEARVYVKPKGLIDSDNQKINQIASELVEGIDDQYLAVFRIASFVYDNIKYAEDNEEVSQKKKSASWVLENKIGVCDEKSTLFIAMLRSVGIPAKYVSGVSYTNLEGFEGWDTHAWSEVYFPKEGWVPYDVTYGEFGYVDPTHIKLKESIDSNESSVKYEWRGHSAKLVVEDLDINVGIIGTEGKADEKITLKSEIIKDRIGFGSFNVLKVSIKNNKDYYVSTKLKAVHNDEIESIFPEEEYIALKPNESKNVYFILKVNEGLYHSYIYEIPIMVYSSRNISTVATFQAKNGMIVYSEEEMKNYVENEKDSEKKQYSKDITIECDSDNKTFFIYETVEYNCKIRNDGNAIIKDLKVCMEENCEFMDFGIGQEKRKVFTKKFDTVGEKDMVVYAKNAYLSKYSYDKVYIVDIVNISINDFEVPEEVMFSDSFQIKFLVRKESKSVPQNVSITIMGKRFSQSWDMIELKKHQEFIINLKGSTFDWKGENVTVIVTYYDNKGKQFVKEAKMPIRLSDPSLFQRLSIYSFDLWTYIQENYL